MMDKLIVFVSAHPLQTVGIFIGSFFAIVIIWKLLKFIFNAINAIESVGTRKLQRWVEKKVSSITSRHKVIEVADDVDSRARLEADLIYERLKISFGDDLDISREQLEILVKQDRISAKMLQDILDGKAEFKDGDTVYKERWREFDPRRGKY